MNDYEKLKSIYETYMHGLCCATKIEWLEALPMVQMLCRLLDEAEPTGYISVYSDRSAKED